MKSFLSSKWIRVIITCLLCLAAGLLICPRKPTVDAEKLMMLVLNAQENTAYEADANDVVYCAGKVSAARKLKFTHDSKGHFRINGRPLSGAVGYDIVLQDSEHNSFVVESSDIIAGRPAWVIRLLPKRDNPEHSFSQIWVDKDKHIILAVKSWRGRELLYSRKVLKITYNK